MNYSQARLILISGLLLLGLFPIGILLGPQHPVYFLVFCGSAFSLSLAVWPLIRVLRALPRTWAWIGGAVLAALVINELLIGVGPPLYRDALIHHLAVPKWWLQDNTIQPYSWHEWSYYPMLVELGFTALLAQNLEPLTAPFHFLFLLALAALVADSIQQKSGSSARAFLSALFLLTIPVVFRLGQIQMVDGGLMLFFTLGVLSTLSAAKSPGESKSLGIISGLSFGLALGCKYNGLLAVAIFFGLLPLYLRRAGWAWPTITRYIVYIGILSLMVFSPWLIRNYAATNNPIYPLGRSLFNSALNAPPAPKALPPLMMRQVQYGESPLEVAALPLRIFFGGKEGDPRQFDGALAPLLLLGFLPLFWKKIRDPERVFLAGYSLVYILLSLVLAGARARYLLPVAPLLVLNASALPLGSLSIAALALVQLWYNALPLAETWHKTRPLQNAFRSESRQDFYLEQISEYPAIEFINQKLPATARVYLLLTGNFFYLYDRPIYSPGYFSGSEMLNALQKPGASQADILSIFGAQGSTHVLIHVPRFEKLLADSPQEKQLFEQFFKAHLRPIFDQRPYLLAEVLP